MCNLFDWNLPDKKITKPIRLIELFAGIGSQSKALENLGADFEHYRICEFDKYAVKSYNAIHDTNFTTSDITKITAEDLGIVDTDTYEYIMTYSFPCQDLSLAGNMKGMSKDSNTRSGLLWQVERLLNECAELPQILLMENVPQVHSKKNIADFNKWQEFLSSKGYTNYWQDLNAKNYGIPQNRNRCFMVSILGNYKYEFPKAQDLELRLKDMLEDDVEEKYYLSDRIVTYFNKHTKDMEEKGNGFRFEPTTGNCVAKTITTRAGSRMDDNFIKLEQVGNMAGGKWDKMHECSKRVYSSKGLAPTLHTCGGGNLEPKIIIKNKDKRLRQLADNIQLDSETKFLDTYNQSTNKIAGTITTGVDFRNEHFLYNDYRIRKLTPRECYRLMGFNDVDFDKAQQTNSNCQLYKQAGNSIVVNVLMEIFKQMI